MSMSSPLEDQIRGLVVELNEAVEELFRENRQRKLFCCLLWGETWVY